MGSQAPSVLRLAPVLDLNAAAPLAAEFAGLRGRPLVVDGSAVQRLGGQCLQVLLSAKATWAADGQDFRLAEASDDLTAALALAGAPGLGAAADPTFPTLELSR